MLNPSAGMHMNRFEVKGMPKENPVTKITDAYGLGKCPKLIQQIAGNDLEVRINALSVLCDEFQNAYSIEGCTREGIIGVLSKMIKDPDYTTRVRSTKALSIAADDANGLKAILMEEDIVIPLIIQGVDDPSEIVRGNVYNCLVNLTKTLEGLEYCVKHDVTKAFVKVLYDEVDSLKPIILKGLHNIVRSEDGLIQALNGSAVEISIKLLDKSVLHISSGNEKPYSEYEASILAESARTLGYMCFDGRAKHQALLKNAIKILLDLLILKKLPTDTKSSITIALMAITTTNDGKIHVNQRENGVAAILSGLYDDNKIIVLNTLKIISNISVYPKNRDDINSDSTCIVRLRKLSKSEDPLIAKHAAIALAAASWKA